MRCVSCHEVHSRRLAGEALAPEHALYATTKCDAFDRMVCVYRRRQQELPDLQATPHMCTQLQPARCEYDRASHAYSHVPGILSLIHI